MENKKLIVEKLKDNLFKLEVIGVEKDSDKFYNLGYNKYKRKNYFSYPQMIAKNEIISFVNNETIVKRDNLEMFIQQFCYYLDGVVEFVNCEDEPLLNNNLVYCRLDYIMENGLPRIYDTGYILENSENYLPTSKASIPADRLEELTAGVFTWGEGIADKDFNHNLVLSYDWEVLNLDSNYSNVYYNSILGVYYAEISTLEDELYFGVDEYELFNYDDGDFLIGCICALEDRNGFARLEDCWESYEREGVYFIDCDERDSYDESLSHEENPYISEYHSSNFVPYVYQKSSRLFGIEIEVEFDSNNQLYYCSEDLYNDRFSDDILDYHLEEDGSLNTGFEIVTRPMMENEVEEIVKRIFSKIHNYDWRNWNCGQHIHISRTAFTCDESIDLFFKILSTDLFQEQVEELGGRKLNRYCESVGFDSAYDKSNNRYYAVNLTNGKTIECRFFSFTLDEQEVLNRIATLNNIIDYCNANHSITDEQLKGENFDEIKNYKI